MSAPTLYEALFLLRDLTSDVRAKFKAQIDATGADVPLVGFGSPVVTMTRPLDHDMADIISAIDAALETYETAHGLPAVVALPPAMQAELDNAKRAGEVFGQMIEKIVGVKL